MFNIPFFSFSFSSLFFSLSLLSTTMDCLFLEPFLYLYYQLPTVADRSGPIPTNVWPPPPPVDVLFHRQRTEFLSKRVFYPWGGQIPRYATELGNVIYEQNCLPLWVPKPKVNMYHALESLHNMAEQAAPLSSILSSPRYDIDDALNTLSEHNERLGHYHIGTQLAEALMDEIAVLPDLSMSSDGQFAFFADHSGLGKTLDIQPFVRAWLGNGGTPGISPWSPCYTSANNLLIDSTLDTLADLSDPEPPSTPATPALDMIDNPLTSSITSTTASTNLMTPRSEVDLFAEAAQDTKAGGLPSDQQYRQDDSDGESDELIVMPRIWNSSILDLTNDTPRRSPSTWSPPPIHLRSYEDDASSDAVHSPVQSILNWRDGTTRSRYVASSTNVACLASECTIVPAAAEASPIENVTGAEERTTLPGESGYEDPVDEESRNEAYEEILPEATVIHVDESTSRWLYGILREQDDDEEGTLGSVDLPSSTSSLGSELSSLCPLRLGPRAVPLWGPPPTFESSKDNHSSPLISIQDVDDLPGSCPSHIQRQPSHLQPPSTMHEEILTWVASPEVFTLPSNCRTEPGPVLSSGKQRKSSWFSRLLNKVTRGPRVIQRMLPITKWLSIPFKIPLRENRNKKP